MKMVPVRLPLDLVDEIDVVASTNGTNASVAIRQLLTEALNNRKTHPMRIPTSDTLVEFVQSSTRYAFLPLAGGGDDLDRVICRACSTRSTIVAIPSVELGDHELALHD